jgi:hypothetical protein
MALQILVARLKALTGLSVYAAFWGVCDSLHWLQCFVFPERVSFVGHQRRDLDG